MLAIDIKNIFDENLTEILSKPNSERLSHFEYLINKNKKFYSIIQKDIGL